MAPRRRCRRARSGGTDRELRAPFCPRAACRVLQLQLRRLLPRLRRARRRRRRRRARDPARTGAGAPRGIRAGRARAARRPCRPCGLGAALAVLVARAGSRDRRVRPRSALRAHLRAFRIRGRHPRPPDLGHPRRRPGDRRSLRGGAALPRRRRRAADDDRPRVRRSACLSADVLERDGRFLRDRGGAVPAPRGKRRSASGASARGRRAAGDRRDAAADLLAGRPGRSCGRRGRLLRARQAARPALSADRNRSGHRDRDEGHLRLSDALERGPGDAASHPPGPPRRPDHHRVRRARRRASGAAAPARPPPGGPALAARSLPARAATHRARRPRGRGVRRDRRWAHPAPSVIVEPVRQSADRSDHARSATGSHTPPTTAGSPCGRSRSATSTRTRSTALAPTPTRSTTTRNARTRRSWSTPTRSTSKRSGISGSSDSSSCCCSCSAPWRASRRGDAAAATARCMPSCSAPGSHGRFMPASTGTGRCPRRRSGSPPWEGWRSGARSGASRSASGWLMLACSLRARWLSPSRCSLLSCSRRRCGSTARPPPTRPATAR